jgi:hypothetical protein
VLAHCFCLLLIPAGLSGQGPVPRAEARRIAAFPEPFSLVRGVRELSTGVVLVTDWTEERLVALDFGHGTATEIGRVGRGPHEFRLPAQLVPLPGDSTLLVDVGNARLAVIGPDLAIHRTLPAQRPGTPYAVTPRGADAAGRLYFGIPPWSQGPDAPPGDSVDIVRWDPRTDSVEPLGRVQGAASTSWQREHRPRMTPGIPMVGYSAQDAWVVLPAGRIVVVRSGDYRVEWRAPGGRVTRGPSYAYPPLPVTDADQRAFVVAFTLGSPMSGRGPEGGLGHTPAEFLSPERIAEDVRTNEFAERHPYFRAGGAWLTPDGELWVERSIPAGAAPVLDVFDGEGRMVRQVTLPAGRRVVGMGRGALYAVVKNADDLETLERYHR